MQLSLVAFQINAPADNGTDDTIDCRTLRCRCYSAELAGSFHSPFSIARLTALNFSHDAHRMPLKTCYKSPAFHSKRESLRLLAVDSKPLAPFHPHEYAITELLIISKALLGPRIRFCSLLLPRSACPRSASVSSPAS